MNKTANFQLTQWEKTDRIMMEDFNRDNAAIDTALHRLQMLRELAFAELRDRGSLYRTCGIAAGLLVILVLV